MNIKEVFFRISPDIEYDSTGFLPQAPDGDFSRLSPRLVLLLNCDKEIIEVDAKYIEKNGTERGPYHFLFDRKKLTMNMRKQGVSDAMYWVKASASDALRVGHEISSLNDDLIDKIMYGIDKKIPDTDFGFIAKKEETFEKKVNGPIGYVSSQIFFKDGTSTDIRIYK